MRQIPLIPFMVAASLWTPMRASGGPGDPVRTSAGDGTVTPPSDTAAAARMQYGSLEIRPAVPGDTVSAVPKDAGSAPRIQPVVLEIRCPVPGVTVYEDSQYLGPAPLTTVSYIEGNHIFRYIPPDAGLCPSASVVETLAFRRGEHLVRTLEFPQVYHLTTEPYGATVRQNGVVVGSTPLDLRISSTKDLITVEKGGFDAATIPLEGTGRQVHILLRPKDGVDPDPQSLYLSGDRSKNLLPIYLASGATVLAGAASAILKTRADDRYNDYTSNGNQETLSQVRRLDLAAGISLAACELSLATLAYLLLSR